MWHFGIKYLAFLSSVVHSVPVEEKTTGKGGGKNPVLYILHVWRFEWRATICVTAFDNL